MPSPIAHAVSGYAIAKGLSTSKVSRAWGYAGYAVFVAISADFDFIPKLVANVDSHRGFTHSLSFALAFSLLLSAIMIRRANWDYVHTLTVTVLIYCSHLLLDFFTQGGSGIPLLWPISNQYFQSAIPLFPAVHHSQGVFNSIHLIFLSFEIIYTLILLWGVSQLSRRPDQRKEREPGIRL